MGTLRQGDSGPGVIALQQKLLAAGFRPGNIDGSFGPGTEAAVIAFQRSEGLVADGIAGPRTLAALGIADAPPLPNLVPGVTVEIVTRMFPVTPVRNIQQHLPFVLGGMAGASMADKPMLLVALASIRAETEAFVPCDEGVSRYNTSPGGRPFDLYDNRRDLGNQGPPDGSTFRGRGFIQLTGRANYQEHGQAIGLGDRLLTEPDLANDPEIASKLLASFLKSKEVRIKQALVDGDLAAARKLVNGGSHGLDRFCDAFRTGDKLIVETAAAANV